MNLLFITKILWVASVTYWIISGLMVKQNVKREQIGWRILHLSCVVLSVILAFDAHIPISFLNHPILPQEYLFKFFGFIIGVTGMILAVWSRIVLGRNWSGRISIKAGHTLINYGPYALARHPIYTGIITGFIGTAMIVGEVRGYLAILLLITTFSIKIHREEKVLLNAFGERYLQYSKKVKRLIPFIY